MPLQAVAFDVDGTLVDSERDGHRVAFNLAFEEAGLPFHWDVDLYGELLLVTGGARRISTYLTKRGISRAEAEELARRLHARKTEIFVEIVRGGGVRPRAGVARLLDDLDHAGIRLAVATTGSSAWVHALLDRLFGRDRFETVITSDEAPMLKPDPAAYRVALETLGVPAGSAVAVEDSRNGLLAAKAAGMRCAMVVNGYTRDHPLGEADLVLDSFGLADAPADVVVDPHGLRPPGLLNVETLKRLADTSTR
jgi:HAD superfamily hydrolase (TIGR01509 family)